MKHILRLVNYYKRYYHLNTTNIFLRWHFSLYDRPSSEEACSVLLPVLATIVMQRGKKLVVRVAPRVAALVPVQGNSIFCSVVIRTF